jgi:hypothetical protein
MKAKAIGMDKLINQIKASVVLAVLVFKRHSEFSLHCKIIRITSGSGLLGGDYYERSSKDVFLTVLSKHFTIRCPIKKITFLGWAFKKILMIRENQQLFILLMI